MQDRIAENGCQMPEQIVFSIHIDQCKIVIQLQLIYREFFQNRLEKVALINALLYHAIICNPHLGNIDYLVFERKLEQRRDCFAPAGQFYRCLAHFLCS